MARHGMVWQTWRDMTGYGKVRHSSTGHGMSCPARPWYSMLGYQTWQPFSCCILLSLSFAFLLESFFVRHNSIHSFQVKLLFRNSDYFLDLYDYLIFKIVKTPLKILVIASSSLKIFDKISPPSENTVYPLEFGPLIQEDVTPSLISCRF